MSVTNKADGAIKLYYIKYSKKGTDQRSVLPPYYFTLEKKKKLNFKNQSLSCFKHQTTHLIL